MSALHLYAMLRRALSLLALLPLAACPEAPRSSVGVRFAAAAEPVPAPAPTRGGSDRRVLRSSAGALATQLRSATEEAERRGMRAYVLFHASWCAPCQVFEHALAHPAMRAMLEGVLLLEVDIDEWDRSQFSALGYGFTVIPTFYRVDRAGRATGRGVDSSAWGTSTPEGIVAAMRGFFAG